MDETILYAHHNNLCIPTRTKAIHIETHNCRSSDVQSSIIACDQQLDQKKKKEVPTCFSPKWVITNYEIDFNYNPYYSDG